jgi:hypothetical protein
MPENEKPASPSAPPPPPGSPGFTGRVPMAEEFDRAKWTLPAGVPIMIAVALVAITVALIVYTNRSKPSASGTITRVAAADQGDSVMVALHINFDNVTDSRLWIKSLKVELETADGQKFTDDAAPSGDVDRYLKAFPVLAEGRVEPLREEMKIPPKGKQTGMIVVVFPVTKAAFDGRKSLSLQMGFYDHPGMVLKQ